MRVGLFIDTDNLGGAESVLWSLASHLARSGHEPIVYHFGNDYLETRCAELEISTRRVADRYFYKKTYRLPWFALRFARRLRADRLDVLHSHLFGPIVAAGLACRLARLPHIGTLHDVYVVAERPSRARLLRLVDLLGTRLVCVSEQMAEFYGSAMGISRRRLMVIRNGVDLARFRATSLEASESEPVRLVTVGRLVPIKRHDLLLDALARLPEGEGWVADIVGEGPQRSALQRRCHELGLDERVNFLGLRSDIAELLGRADAFALVSDSEGMSLSLLEAVASGLPVVATRVGNNTELVTHGVNGLLIEPGDRAALTEALRSILENAELRRRFAASSRQLADEHLTLDRTLSEYLALYSRSRQNSV